MRGTEHARSFLCYADAAIFSALRDLPRTQWESPRVYSREELEKRAVG